MFLCPCQLTEKKSSYQVENFKETSILNLLCFIIKIFQKDQACFQRLDTGTVRGTRVFSGASEFKTCANVFCYVVYEEGGVSPAGSPSPDNDDEEVLGFVYSPDEKGHTDHSCEFITLTSEHC